MNLITSETCNVLNLSSFFHFSQNFDSIGKIDFSFHQTKLKKLEASMSRQQSKEDLRTISGTPTNQRLDKSHVMAAMNELSMLEPQAVNSKPPLPGHLK